MEEETGLIELLATQKVGAKSRRKVPCMLPGI